MHVYIKSQDNKIEVIIKCPGDAISAREHRSSLTLLPPQPFESCAPYINALRYYHLYFTSLASNSQNSSGNFS